MNRDRTRTLLVSTAVTVAAVGFVGACRDATYDNPPTVGTTTTTAAPTTTTTIATQVVPDSGPVAPVVSTVASVHDGDTITLADGRRLRIIGIDTPEINGAVDRPDLVDNDECWGAEAANALKTLLPPGTPISLIRDRSDTDYRGRLLRYVELVDIGDVGAWLVVNGYATSYRYGKDTARSDLYDQLEAKAQAARAGMWGYCS